MNFTTRDTLNNNLQKGLGAIFFVWLGIILGVSFLATPVKFQAPHLTLAVALEVGKVTFHLLHKVEWGLLALTFFLAYLAKVDKKNQGSMLILGIILALQNLWLIPTLDLRIDAIVAGITLPPRHFHITYITIEILKLVLLGFIAFLLTWNTLDHRERRKIFIKKL